MSNKPLGRKAYGSIPHLPNSRLGEGDHCVNSGLERIATQKPRDKNDVVIIQEKLDGSCVSVAKINGDIVPLNRAGYPCRNAPQLIHQQFYHWVFQAEHNRHLRQYSFFDMLKDGERVVGEWLTMAHGTKYDLPHEPFVAFDIMRGVERVPFLEAQERLLNFKFTMPRLLSYGSPQAVDWVLKRLDNSSHGALDPVEGAVWRVERNARVDFLCKYVRPEKKDGAYFPQISGNAVVWNTWDGKSLETDFFVKDNPLLGTGIA